MIRLPSKIFKIAHLMKRSGTKRSMQQLNYKGGTVKLPKSDEKISPLGWFLLAIPTTTFGLGCWQVKRKIWKEQLIHDLQTQLKMAPEPIPEDFTQLKEMEYRLVKVRGRFLHDKEMLLGPRSLIRPDGGETTGGLFSQRDTGNGYLVITPFQLTGRDDIILINRGWISRAHKKSETRANGQITDEIELTGVVRLSETRPQFTPDHKGGVFLYRDLPKMCSLTGASPVFLDAVYSATGNPSAPIGGQTRVTLRNDHLSYIITWFSLSAATSYLWYKQVIRKMPF